MAVVLTLLDSGSDSTSSTTTTTVSVTATGSANPIFIVVAAPVTSAVIAYTTAVFNSGAQSMTSLGVASADGSTDTMTKVYYIDAPSAGSGTITLTHASSTVRRVWQVYEVSGHLTSSASAWRDSPTAGTTIDGTTHEDTVTSAVGDYPFSALSLKQSASAPTLTLNGTTTTITNTLGGTTERLYTLKGTGAATVVLGGTTTTISSARIYFNINVAASNAPHRLVSSVPLNSLITGGLAR